MFQNIGQAPYPKVREAACPNFGQASCPKVGNAAFPEFGEPPFPNIWGGGVPKSWARRAQILETVFPESGRGVKLKKMRPLSQKRGFAQKLSKRCQNAGTTTRDVAPNFGSRARPNFGRTASPNFWAQGLPNFWARRLAQILGSLASQSFRNYNLS